MSLVIVDGELEQKLNAADRPVQVCTPQGKVLGYFTPTKPVPIDLDPGISGEELDRRYAEGGGRTWAEIRADLEKQA